MTENAHHLNSPHCVLWIQRVGKTAKGPVMKQTTDVRVDMGDGGFNALSLQGPICHHLRQGLKPLGPGLPEGLRQGPGRAKCRNTNKNYGMDASSERTLGWKSRKLSTSPRSAYITQLYNQQLGGAMVKGWGQESRLCYFYFGDLGFCK